MDVFKPFLQRLSQPILLSFCIAWIFWNWEIVVALCWYDAKNIEKLGFKNHMEYIKSLKDTWRNFLWPLIVAGLYPLSILILNNFYTFFKTLEDKLFTKIVKNATVPTDLYLDAQDKIEAKEKRISKFIELETEMQGEINDLKIENRELEGKLNSLSSEHLNIESIKNNLETKTNKLDELVLEYENKSNIDFFTGKYEFMIYEKLPNNNLVKILNSSLEVIKNDNEDKYLINLNFKDALIVSEVTEYFYNILSNTVGIKTNIIENNFVPHTPGDRNLIEIVKQELMDGFIKLQKSNSSDIKFIKEATFKESGLRIDLKKLNLEPR